MPKLKNQFPKLCRDRNQAISWYKGKRVYHGVWGSPEAKESYNRLVRKLEIDAFGENRQMRFL